MEMQMEMDVLRYPIGKFDTSQEISEDKRRSWLVDIADAPQRLASAIEGLDAVQLDTPYRPGGWTIRQVVHHVPDSHMNAYIRFKLALTEEQPTIRPYFEDRWAELNDSKETPVQTSLRILQVLHERWMILLNGLHSEDFDRTFYHPESGVMTLNQAVGMYAWHGQHHVAHITSLRQRMSW